MSLGHVAEQGGGVSTHRAVFDLPAPGVTPVLDPLFRPAALAWRAFRQRAHGSPGSALARFALEQSGGAVSRFETELLPEDESDARYNFRMLERLVKLALWSRGGFRLHVDAPASLVERLRV